MTLVITKEGNILTVVECIYSFHGTRRSYWYYNLDTWMMSSHGREGDTTDRTMRPSDIEWVQTHYLSKVAQPV